MSGPSNGVGPDFERVLLGGSMAPAFTSHHATHREGEQLADWQRSGRTFLAGDGWHVKTREGHPLGPYASEFDAAVVAALLIAQLAQAPNLQACRRIIYNFRHDDRFKTPSEDDTLGRIDRIPEAEPGDGAGPREALGNRLLSRAGRERIA